MRRIAEDHGLLRKRRGGGKLVLGDPPQKNGFGFPKPFGEGF